MAISGLARVLRALLATAAGRQPALVRKLRLVGLGEEALLAVLAAARLGLAAGVAVRLQALALQLGQRVLRDGHQLVALLVAARALHHDGLGLGGAALGAVLGQHHALVGALLDAGEERVLRLGQLDAALAVLGGARLVVDDGGVGRGGRSGRLGHARALGRRSAAPALRVGLELVSVLVLEESHLRLAHVDLLAAAAVAHDGRLVLAALQAALHLGVLGHKVHVAAVCGAHLVAVHALHLIVVQHVHRLGRGDGGQVVARGLLVLVVADLHRLVHQRVLRGVRLGRLQLRLDVAH